MKVHWLPGAIDDLREIRDYIAEDNPTAAQAMAAHFYAAEERIEEFPLLQAEGEIPGIRELVVRRYRCVIGYRIKEERIEVVWVFGPGQDRVAIAKRDPR